MSKQDDLLKRIENAKRYIRRQAQFEREGKKVRVSFLHWLEIERKLSEEYQNLRH